MAKSKNHTVSHPRCDMEKGGNLRLYTCVIVSFCDLVMYFLPYSLIPEPQPKPQSPP
ncbi:hypothetical protein M427DRAFT_52434 [Gonapodya prolifera JEL478]|uniref:Uncharacterized protein n=1 Tax=Gonapodya prolifera (strain JEL478) TaxID=1344416 RepID=A0A139ATX8_GONPJ|nr:hypothetical protein M427DRAFT_52434 [Gonapodya prolifera JEL478]|eukprot:KXS20181.1 hypothetical protein M427DRAFT_52434 [Gonapodya prolifera JEL478]